VRLHFGRKEDADFEPVVNQYPDSEFKNLTRSTVPLLCYWSNAAERLESLLGKLQWGDVGLEGMLCFEYPVKSVGRARASCTDIMYLSCSPSAALGIEGKSTESRYTEVTRWLDAGKNRAFREQVLEHWLDLIRSCTGEAEKDRVADLPYQMIHRTASVCSLRKGRAAVLYQVFRVKGHAYDYEPDLRKLSEAISAGGKIAICLHEIETIRSASYGAVEDRLKPDLDAETRAEIVRNAILDGELFDFGQEQFVRIA